MAQVTAINHVTVIVDDLATAVRFYAEDLGLTKLPAFDLDFPVQFFRVNDQQQLHVTEWKDTPSFRGHVCFEVDDFTTVFNRMKAIDVIDTSPWGLVRRLPDGAMQMFVRDPAGNLLEITCPSTANVDEAIFSDALVQSEAGAFESGRDDQRGERGDDATLYHSDG
jgi:catechol 2,3-dioxygenase-like lactoylglutathione lyase family enzyme